MANETTFRITTYGFGELAQMYLPHIKSKSASARLSAWINLNLPLQEALSKAGYRKGMKVLTPKMVAEIYAHLGDPY